MKFLTFFQYPDFLVFLFSTDIRPMVESNSIAVIDKVENVKGEFSKYSPGLFKLIMFISYKLVNKLVEIDYDRFFRIIVCLQEVIN